MVQLQPQHTDCRTKVQNQSICKKNMQAINVAKLPLGLQSFAEVRKLQCAYVDKTPLALKLIKDGKFYFLSRPRRFGKSLFLDTLRYLFEGERELFQGLYADKNWHWSAKYPVVKLDMSGIFKKPAGLESRLCGLLENNAINLGVALRGQGIATQFSNLIIDANRQYGQQTVLLVDEYDKPMIDNIGNIKLALQMRDQLQGFYSIIKAVDEHLRFVMLTGVSKFSKVSIFSGLNNLEDISLNPNYGSICGYAEKDLKGVFGEYLRDIDRGQLRRWYNGYNFLGTDLVYNPYDILNFIKRSHSLGEPDFGSYWFETSTPTFVVDLLTRNNLSAHQLEPLEVRQSVLDSCPIEKLELNTVLFQSGYLTIDKIVSSNISGRNRYRLKCPNHSVRSALQDQLFSYYTAGDSTSSYQDKMESALMSAEFDVMEAELRRLFASIATDNYRKNNIARFEGYYAAVVYSFLAGMGLNVIAEDASSHGRIDLTIQLADYTYIVEFKVVEYPSATNSALQQIIQRGYAAKYSGKVYQIGIEFSETERNITDFAWQYASSSWL